MLGRGEGWVVFAALVTGCNATRPDVQAAWIVADAEHSSLGRVHVYDRGEVRTIVWEEPAIQHPDTDLQWDLRGEMLAVVESQRLWMQEVGSGRARQERDVALGAFTRRGDGFLTRAEAGELMLVPADPRLTPVVVPTALQVDATTTASDGSVVAVIEHGDDVTVEFWSYERSLGDNSAPVRLGQAHVDALPRLGGPGRVSGDWCAGDLCLSPDGTSATSMGEVPCEIRWWTTTMGELAVHSISLASLGCASEDAPSLVAQIGPAEVVLEGTTGLYLVDLESRVVEVATKWWSNSAALFPVANGRALVMVSPSLQIARIDAGGIQVIRDDVIPELAALQGADPALDQPIAVSPSGTWTLVWAPFLDATESSLVGAVARVSSLGTEVYVGVSMVGLGVDDSGDALLYSLTTEMEPQALYVLTHDGDLVWLDDLAEAPIRLPIAAREDSPYFVTPSRRF